jgi:hypothetical protein
MSRPPMIPSMLPSVETVPYAPASPRGQSFPLKLLTGSDGVVCPHRVGGCLKMGSPCIRESEL